MWEVLQFHPFLIFHSVENGSDCHVFNQINPKKSTLAASVLLFLKYRSHLNYTASIDVYLFLPTPSVKKSFNFFYLALERAYDFTYLYHILFLAAEK